MRETMEYSDFYTYVDVSFEGKTIGMPISKFEMFADFIRANADRTTENPRLLCVEAAAAIIYGNHELAPVLSICNRNYYNLNFDFKEISHPSKEWVMKILVPLLSSFQIDAVLLDAENTTLRELPSSVS